MQAATRVWRDGAVRGDGKWSIVHLQLIVALLGPRPDGSNFRLAPLLACEALLCTFEQPRIIRSGGRCGGRRRAHALIILCKAHRVDVEVSTHVSE